MPVRVIRDRVARRVRVKRNRDLGCPLRERDLRRVRRRTAGASATKTLMAMVFPATFDDVAVVATVGIETAAVGGHRVRGQGSHTEANKKDDFFENFHVDFFNLD